MDLYEIPVFTTDGAIGLPFCRLPISKDLVFSAGASITHEEELITKIDSQLWILENKKINFYRDTFDDYCDKIIDSIK